jgi:cell division septation protein DedD
VTAEQLELAKRAWKAFGSEDPTSISRLLEESTTPLKHLAPALRRHLEEFPATDNGLSRSEREALSAIQAGHSSPVAAFLEVARKQESIFLGDIIFYSYLERLSGRTNPLITWKDGTPVIAPTSERSREFVEGELALTPLGREVLAGRQDWQRINKRTRWLGGVEISPGEGEWRWDPSNRELVRGKTASKSGTTQARPANEAVAKRPLTKRPATKKPTTKKPTTKKPTTKKSATKRSAAKKSTPKKRKK